MYTLQRENKILLLSMVTVAVICVILYLPVLQFDFVNFDDPDYVLNNPMIKGLTPSNLATMFTHSHVGWWMPLTWLSLAIDYHFWGVNPAGYHLTNILFHGVNAGLVVLIADTVCRSVIRAEPLESGPYYTGLLIFSGLFFGIHPLRVESVAWVTERKDVLNGLFTFLSLIFYLHFAKGKDAQPDSGRNSIYYVLSFICFLCSLMSKSVSVVLPAMMLTLDWVPLGRLRNRSLRWLIIEKWPFWVASFLMAFFTFVFAAQSQYLVNYESFPFYQRAIVSGNAIWEYGRLLIFPNGLSPFNVIPDPIPFFSYSVKAFLVAALLVWLCIAGRKRFPYLTSSIFFALLPLLPVLAFFQNGDQSYADRFTYLPSLSPAIFLALLFSGISPFALNAFSRRVLAVCATLIVVALLLITFRQQAVWRSTEPFWTRIINIEPMAINYRERGCYYHALGRYDKAIADFTAALGKITPTLKPYEYNFYAFRAESFRMKGKLEEALKDFDIAIRLHPHPAYYYHRGLTLQAMGRNAEAEDSFRLAGQDVGPIEWID